MSVLQKNRFNLSTGIALDVTFGGPQSAPAILMLHGYPESSRTWRYQMDALKKGFRVIAPSQRGFAYSDKPPNISDYTVNRIVEDVFALADTFDVDQFTLIGHDWGGAIAWASALKHPERINKLVIINAPHPYIFQQTLFTDEAQCAASQYIRDFKLPDMERNILHMGLDKYFDKHFLPLVFSEAMTLEDRNAYIEEWAQPNAIKNMLNWYKASPIIVPDPKKKENLPDWLDKPFPQTRMPVLVVWGIYDRVLLPVQLDQLSVHVPNLQIVRVEAGHFATWENPQAVNTAILNFMNAKA